MSIIAAGTTTTTALSSTGNTDGTLQFQVNGTTPSVTLNTLGAIGVGSSPSYGTSGQVLVSAGSTAAPAWTTNVSSQWTTTGSDIYYNTGNVGIGTSSPGNKLNVVSSSSTIAGFTSSSSSAFLGLANSGATTFIGNDSTSGNFIIQTPASGFSTKLTLDPTGNLGLGVTPSAWRSTTKAIQLGQAGVISASTNQNLTAVAMNDYVDSGGTERYINTGFASLYQQVSGQHQFYTAASGTAGNAISFTQAMTLAADGNLLVGTTTSPSYSGYTTLALNSATNGGLLDIQLAGSRIGSFQAGSSTELRLYANTSVATTLYGGGSERLRIASTGAFGLSGANYGTSGQVLTSGGSGAAPTWASPAGGGSWIYLSTVTASNSSSADIESTFNSTYDTYLIQIESLRKSSTGSNNNVQIFLKIGGSYITAANYFWDRNANGTYGSNFDYANIDMTTGLQDNGDSRVSAEVLVHIPTDSSFKHISWDAREVSGPGGARRLLQDVYGSGSVSNSGALTGVRFVVRNENIYGTFRLYGLKTS